MRESIFNYHIEINGKNYIYNTNNRGLIEVCDNPLKKDDMKAMYEYGFLVDDNADEAKMLQDEINQNIINGSETLEVTIELTNQCNFRCVYCYQDKNEKMMSWEVAEEILLKMEEILSNGNYKKIYIHYFGGEPLMNIPILLHIHENIKRISESLGIKYTSYITTNGSMLDDELLGKVKFDYVQLTFDGLEKTHNSLRCSDTFKYADEMKLLEKLLTKSHATVILRMNASIQNKDEILEFYEKVLSRYGIEKININLNRMIKFHKEDKFDMLSEREYAEIFCKIQLLQAKYAGELKLPVPRGLNCKFICGIAYVISPDGYCDRCSGSVGNGKTRFKDVDVSRRKQICFRKECMKCTFLPLCLGGCDIQHDIGVGSCTYEKFCMGDILKNYIKKGA